MSWPYRWLGGILLGLSLPACAPTTPATAGDTVVDTAAVEQAISAVREREIRGFSAGAVDSVLAVQTADAVMMPPNEPARTGAAEIRSWLQTVASQFAVEGRYTDSKIDVAGDWAIERYIGHLKLTPKAGGPAVEERMKGIHVYRRQPDGSWRIAQDVWNVDAPPAAPAAAK